MARALIAFLVAIEGSLPAVRFMATRKKCQVGRMPISRHETFQVLPVPSGLLFFHHFSDCGARGIASIFPATRGSNNGKHAGQQNQMSHGKTSVSVSHR